VSSINLGIRGEEYSLDFGNDPADWMDRSPAPSRRFGQGLRSTDENDRRRHGEKVFADS